MSCLSEVGNIARKCCDEIPKPGEVPEKVMQRVSKYPRFFSISTKSAKLHLSFQTPGDILGGCFGAKKNKCLPKMVGDIRVLPLPFEKKILVHLSFTKTSTKACAKRIPQQNSTHQARGNPWLSDRSKPRLIKQKHTDRHRPPIEKL